MLGSQWIVALALQGAVAPVDFARDVRPILSDRCFACHGPGDQSGGFRLDLREEATEGYGGDAPLVPGDAAASLVMERVRHRSPKRRMPPVDSKLELSEEEIGLLERWIDEGALYSEHWSFVPPRRVPPPQTESGDWGSDELDAFVLERMGRAGLRPAPEADRASWLRRVSYDLTGLPPSIEELDRFLSDEGEQAFERVVEALLASPRHAERMTTVWLDAARYADTYGYQSDVERRVWPWRDWVIESFARNQPYDEFLTWQIAGDLLPGATREQRLATAFNRLHRQTNEGGSTEEEYRVEYVADRVQTLSTAVLGLTMECARCHDHKFDPFSQREFYGLFAFFDDIDESGLYSHFTNAVPTPALDLPSDEQAQDLVRLMADVARVEQDARAGSARDEESLELSAGLQGLYRFELEQGAQAHNSVQGGQPGKLADGVERSAGQVGGGLRFSGDDPLHLPEVGHFQRSDPFSLGLWLWLPQHYERAVVAHRSRAWTDSGSRGYELLIEDGRASAALVHFWPGDALRVRTRSVIPIERWTHVALTYDGSSRAAGLRLYVDGLPAELDVVRDQLGRTILGGGIEHLTLGERFRDRGLAGGRVDELAIFARELAAGEVERWASGGLEGAGLASSDGAGQRHEALEELRAARRARDEARDAIPQIMTMAALGEERTAYLLERGSYLSRGEPVEPHTPAALPPLASDTPRDRLALARWLTDPGHPLTARVEVNRIWQLLFGRGLVATPEDFGNQGAPPTHPELLDQLALDLVASGWDRRALLRRIVLSATYRQSSEASAEARERDPENRWLSHATRRQLSAEMLRDGALFAAGLLVEEVGGPPVKPYQPAGLWKEKSGHVYTPDGAEGLWRRSLYTYWKRTSPPPAMMILDAAKRDVCVVERAVTSTPLQALLVWNDPQFVEAARGLALRALAHSSDDDQRIDFLLRSLTSRQAREEETELLLGLLREEREAFGQRPDRARDLLAVGEAPVPDAIDEDSLAAWTIVARTVLSLDAALRRS